MAPPTANPRRDSLMRAPSSYNLGDYFSPSAGGAGKGAKTRPKGATKETLAEESAIEYFDGQGPEADKVEEVQSSQEKQRKESAAGSS
eukprot:7957689-Alexandrium_andersonii.AAC.1